MLDCQAKLKGTADSREGAAIVVNSGNANAFTGAEGQRGVDAVTGAVAQALAALGFDVAGWSASGRAVDGVTALAGADLGAALARAEILISLLPDTPDTRNLLDARRLAMLPPITSCAICAGEPAPASARTRCW